MKVSQLIEALQHMPPDAEVLTLANNHYTRTGDSMRVGVIRSNYLKDGVPQVLVGNWDGFNVRCLSDASGRTGYTFEHESFAVVPYLSNELRRQTLKYTPAHTRPRTVREDVPDSYAWEAPES